MTYNENDKNNPTLEEMRYRAILDDRISYSIDKTLQSSWETRVWEFAILRQYFILLIDEMLKMKKEIEGLRKESK